MIRLAGMTGILTLLLGVGNLVGHIGAAETPFAGVWKVVGTLPAQGGGQDSILGLVEIKGDEKSPKVELLTHGIEPFKNAKATGATLKDGELTFALSSGQLNIFEATSFRPTFPKAIKRTSRMSNWRPPPKGTKNSKQSPKQQTWTNKSNWPRPW